MAVRIRLTRVGATKRPSYRVIAIDKRRPRDGRALDILGFYDPLTEPATVQIDGAKLESWLKKGAQPSDTVVRLMHQAGLAGDRPAPKRTETTKARPKRSKKAAAREAAAEGEQAAPKTAGATPAAEPAAEPAAADEPEAQA